MKQKSNSKIELLFILGFLFTLIIAFGTFFFGLRTGINQTEQKYAYLKVEPGEETENSYQQQDLVTFYYVVFQPYLDFKNSYINSEGTLDRSSSLRKSENALKEIRESAQKQYQLISSHSIPGSSPLLKEAQSDILKSLKLFEKSADHILAKTDDYDTSELSKLLLADQYGMNAKNYGLQAQKKYYASILKWSAKSNSKLPTNVSYREDITIDEWNHYPLAVKNKSMSDLMVKNKLFSSYLPQDMTAKIDQMIQSGKAKTLKLDTITNIVNVLIETEAIHGEEFLKYKTTYYAGESLPNLPFFSEE